MTKRRNTGTGRYWLGALAVAAGAAMAAAPAYAAPAAPRPAVVHPQGFEPGSVITHGDCKGWLNTKKIHGRWYAQALVKSWGDTCGMMLQRSHNGGSYKRISYYHFVKNGSQSYTGYYYDDRGYKARVCINGLHETAWHCGKGI